MVPSITRELPTKQLIFLLIAAAFAVPFAGCGGDDSSGSETQTYSVEASTTMLVASPPLTKQQFVDRTNQDCQVSWVRIQENVDAFRRKQDPKLSEKERFAETVRDLLLGEIVFHIFDAIRIRGAPSGETEEIEEIIGPMQASSELGQKGRPALYTIEQLTEHYREYNQGARKYGIDECLIDEAHVPRI